MPLWMSGKLRITLYDAINHAAACPSLPEFILSEAEGLPTKN